MSLVDVNLVRRPALGISHSWWDGPHCVLSLGFLRIHTEAREGCKKCYPK